MPRGDVVGVDDGRPRDVDACVGCVVGTLVFDGVTVEFPGPPADVVDEGKGDVVAAVPLVADVAVADGEVDAPCCVADADGTVVFVVDVDVDNEGLGRGVVDVALRAPAPPNNEVTPGRSESGGVESRAVSGASTRTVRVDRPTAAAPSAIREPCCAPIRAQARARSVRRRRRNRSGRSACRAAKLFRGAARWPTPATTSIALMMSDDAVAL